jgi:phospholipid/cholesterol/gamma-HCH transport system substrate-binding protein
VSDTLSNLRDITNKLNSGQGTMGKLINDSTLHDQLLATVAELKTTATDAQGFVTSAKGVMDQVKQGKGVLGVLLYDQQAADNLKSTVQNIHDVSDKLASGKGTLGKLINDDTLYNSAQTSLKKADRALDSLNDSGPITAVGILANALF